jgi:hypothetical protein
MEEYKIGETEIGDRIIEQFVFKFTNEDKERIRDQFVTWEPDWPALSVGTITKNDIKKYRKQSRTRRF